MLDIGGHTTFKLADSLRLSSTRTIKEAFFPLKSSNLLFGNIADRFPRSMNLKLERFDVGRIRDSIPRMCFDPAIFALLGENCCLACVMIQHSGAPLLKSNYRDTGLA